LTRDATGARLALADGRNFSANDWQALSEQTFGSRLPLDDLPSWLAGISEAEAGGWRLKILDRQAGDAGAPVLIEVSRDDLVVRFRIDHWSSP
jgi:outer membrane biogenesis lipoprotein LolB